MTARLTCSLVFVALAAASVDAPGGPAPRSVRRAIAISPHVTPHPVPVQRVTLRATLFAGFNAHHHAPLFVNVVADSVASTRIRH